MLLTPFLSLETPLNSGALPYHVLLARDNRRADDGVAALLKVVAIDENHGLGVTETALAKIRHRLLLTSVCLDGLVSNTQLPRGIELIAHEERVVGLCNHVDDVMMLTPPLVEATLNRGYRSADAAPLFGRWCFNVCV